MRQSKVVDDMECCFFCGRPRQAIHHVFFGTALRKISDKNGFVVPLCLEHHVGNTGVHRNKVLDNQLKQYCQKQFEKNHSREDFRRLIGKSYL